jgi:predicted hydrocarbon binding protein
LKGVKKRVFPYYYEKGKKLVHVVVKLSDAPGSYSTILDILRPKLNLISTLTYTLRDGTAIFSGFAEVLSQKDSPESLEKAILTSKAALEVEVEEGEGGLLVDSFHTGLQVGEEDYLLMRSAAFTHVLDRVSRILGSGGEALLFEEGYSMGQNDAEQMVRLLGTEAVRSKAEYLRNVLTAQGWGQPELERSEKDTFLVKVNGCVDCRNGTKSRAGCNFIRGYFAGSIGAVFGPEMNVKETKCTLKGASFCEFLLTPKGR